MNILITVTENYLKPTLTLIRSIVLNNKTKIIFYMPYMVDAPFSSKAKHAITKNIGKGNEVIFFSVEQNSKIFLDGINNASWNYCVWLKLSSLYFLPHRVSKLLYVDGDMIINGDLSPLYDTNFDNNLFVGVNESWGDNNVSSLSRIHQKQDGKYICGGILLINVDAFLNRIKTIDTFLEKIKALPFFAEYQEQDFINYYFHDELLAINNRDYNFFALYSKRKREEKIVVYHYAGQPKPWVKYNYLYPVSNYLVYLKYCNIITRILCYVKIVIEYPIFTLKRCLRKIKNVCK